MLGIEDGRRIRIENLRRKNLLRQERDFRKERLPEIRQ